MYVNLSKKFITENILPYLHQFTKGRRIKVALWRIIQAIVYRLKSGSQWRELPMKQFFGNLSISWNTVYYHYNKWSKLGSWKKLWIKYLEDYRGELDFSICQLDGSHTSAKRGGEGIGYSKRKAGKTTNALFLTDKNGIPVAMSVPRAGNHHDAFELEKNMQSMIDDLNASQIREGGIFLNADAAFDTQAFRSFCNHLDIVDNIDFNKRNKKDLDNQPFKDEEMYELRFVIERTNAWLDAFKALIMRYETKIHTWQSLHYLAFTLIFARTRKKHS
ncbi:IS5 family transposase [Bernardetia sp. Wsw4-3y2]|uniref:IS5 family transposase n=1 Tax=Bernardetia sp. Wsw4-3y2 TaxID=3127471 RepID=UPI0030CFBD7D